MRGRRYQVTQNDGTLFDNCKLAIQALAENRTEYICYCTETAPSTGHVHMHIYMRFQEAVEFQTIRDIFPGAHVEICSRSEAANIAYCKKHGDFHEYGTPHMARGENAKVMWREIIAHCEANDLEWVKDEYPQIYATRLRDLERIRAKMVVRESIPTLENLWVRGETGSGKSRAIHEQYPGLYKKNWNKWFDNYEYEDTVLIEDADPDVCEHMGYFVKIWGDHYPFNAEYKGGMFKGIRPRRIIITSQYKIEECFKREEDVAAIKRRFHEIVYCSLR